MGKLLKDCFTGIDGESWDLGRILWFKAVIVFLALSCYTVYKCQPFDPAAFGTGLGLVLAAGGAALGFKAGTEPKGK